MTTFSFPRLTALLAAASAAATAQTQFVARTDPLGPLSHFVHVAAADFDGDGDDDFCGSNPLGVRLWRNDGGEHFTDVTSTSVPVLPPGSGAGTHFVTRLLAFDIENDGDIDLLVVRDGDTLLWQNQGNGTFTDVSSGFPANWGGYSDLLAADLDGDGDLDVVTAGIALFGGDDRMFVNQGNGTLTPGTMFGTSFSRSIAAADIDADGDLDVLLAGGGGLMVLRNDGNLVLTDVTATWAPGLVTAFAGPVVSGELDGDGRPDLVVAANGNPDRVLHNTGTTFVLAGSVPNAGNNGHAVLADVDDDGDLDLVRGTTAGVTLAINDGLGALTLSPSRLPALPTQGALVTACDFDRDGDRDVFVTEFHLPNTLLVNRHRDLRPGQPVIGQTWHVELWSEPGYAAQSHAVVLCVALFGLAQPVTLAPFGLLSLDLAAPHALFPGVVPTATGVCTFPLAVPQAPALVGLPLHVQGLADQTVGAPHLSAYFAVSVQ